MLTNIRINGINRRVFLLKEDVAASIVIPLFKLDVIDYRRLLKLSQAAGNGEMMKHMRDAKLDNGRNALATFAPIITVVKKDKKPEVKQAAPAAETNQEATPKRRGPGRPPKKKVEEPTTSAE